MFMIMIVIVIMIIFMIVIMITIVIMIVFMIVIMFNDYSCKFFKMLSLIKGMFYLRISRQFLRNSVWLYGGEESKHILFKDSLKQNYFKIKLKNGNELS